MASSEVVQHDQVETNTTSPNNPPLVLLNRTSVFDISYDTWRPTTKFRFLNPLDPSSSTPEAQTLAQSARVILCLGPSAVTKDTLDRYPSIECVVGSSVGLDHVDLPECRRRGITVTNAGDAYSADVADIAVALLVDVLRRVSASNRYLRAGLWPVKGDYLLGSKLGEKEIGIVGLGSIGSMIAKRLESFGCKIAYKSRRKKAHVLFPYYANVQDLATNSDVLVFCCALTNETFHIINKDVMTALGKEGVIVNVGRGSLIDEKELVQFLVRGDIGGAGLDVYEDEPNVPRELFGLDNVVLSPHRAVATTRSHFSCPRGSHGQFRSFFCK